MNKIAELIFDLIVAFGMVLLSVLIYFGLRMETVVNLMGQEVVGGFLSDVKKNGYFTTDDYENFVEKLSLTNVLYNVVFEHNYETVEPEYRMKTLEEILAAQRDAYEDSNIYHYREVVTQKPEVIIPDNSGISMNTETNESILASSPSSPSVGHVHTDACYAGHKHKGGDNLTFVHTHTHGSSCSGYVSSSNLHIHCNSCGSTYWTTVAAYYLINGSSQTAFVDTTWAYKCVNCNRSNVYSLGQVNEYTYSCGYNKDINGDGFRDQVSGSQQYICNVPQGIIKATYTSGCYTYHQHPTWHEKADPTSVVRTYQYVMQYGLSNFCVVPAEFYIGFDTYDDGDEQEDWRYNSCDTYVRYVTTYTKDKGLLFVYGGYRMWRNSPHVWTNPGFPETLTEEQLKNFYASTYFYKIFGYSLSKSYNIIGGDFNTCDFTTENSNKWILTCGQIENATIVCNKRVISITPTNPLQAVYTDEPLIATVRATYQDGSTQVVLATTDFSTSTVISDKTVTLSYTDETGGITITTVLVTVVPRTKTCPNGHVYTLDHNGADPGCPFCDKWVESIRVLSPTTSKMTINIGTTLQQNGVTILVRYYDGDTETLTSGYADNLDNTYLGTKLVTIGYKGATTSLMVTTVCLKMTCDICSYIYDLNPDGTNPGCPMCISKTPVFTGNILLYENVDYTEDILEELYKDGIYRLGIGDVFTVGVENRSVTLAHNILKKVYRSLPKQWMFVKKSVSIKEN